MKAIIYAGVDRPEVVDRPIPVIGKGEALINVKSVGLCGSDMSIIAGKHPRAQVGLIPGHEFAGELVEIDSDIDTDFRTGDKVTVYPLLVCGKCWACRNGFEHVCDTLHLIGIDQDGGMAEYVKVPVDLLQKLPESVDYDIGSMIEPLAVGIHSCRVVEVNSTDKTVVIGAGPIGLVMGICLKHFGVETIVVTDINPNRLKIVEELGLVGINVETCDVFEEIQKITNGDSADLLFECAGTQTATDQMCDLVHSRGKIIMVSIHKEMHKVDLRSINFKEIKMIGARVYTRKDFCDAANLVNDTPVQKLISHQMPLDKISEGLDMIKSGCDVCKIILNPCQ